MLQMTEALHRALIDGEGSRAGGLLLGGGAGVCEHHYSRARKQGCLPLMPPSLEPSADSLGKTAEETTLTFVPASGWRVKHQELWVQPRDVYQFFSTWGTLLSLWLQVMCLLNEKGGFCSFEGNDIYFLRALEPDTAGCYYQPTTRCQVDPKWFPSPGLWFLSAKWDW